MVTFETRFYVVEVDSSAMIVFIRRKPLDYPDLPAMESDLHAVSAALDDLGRDRKKLLVDLREGPRRNDPQFEDAIRRLRPRLFRGFRGAACIVKTAVGALQVKRHLREDGIGAEVFHDEQEALEYLRGQSVRGEAPPSVLASRRAPRRITRAEGDRPSSSPPEPMQERSILHAAGARVDPTPPSVESPETLPSRLVEDDEASLSPPASSRPSRS